MVRYSTEYLGHVQAENDEAADGEDSAEGKLEDCILRVDPSDVEVYRSMLPNS